MMQCARPPVFNIVNHVWILTSTLLSWLDCPVLYFYTKLDKNTKYVTSFSYIQDVSTQKNIIDEILAH